MCQFDIRNFHEHSSPSSFCLGNVRKQYFTEVFLKDTYLVSSTFLCLHTPPFLFCQPALGGAILELEASQSELSDIAEEEEGESPTSESENQKVQKSIIV